MKLVHKWLEIINDEMGCFADLEGTAKYLQPQFESGMLRVQEVAGGRGVVACYIFVDIFGQKTCSELIVYIKPEYRGNSRRFIEAVRALERLAVDEGCVNIRLGATIGYKDDSVLKAYERLGYKVSGVSKCVQDLKQR